MAEPKFSTYWVVNGQRYDDFAEVKRLVLAQNIAYEVSATQQHVEWQRQQIRERLHRQSIDRYAKASAEQAFRASPEGLRAEVIRNAAQHPGGIVSRPENPGISELDSFGPDATNVFK